MPRLGSHDVDVGDSAKTGATIGVLSSPTSWHFLDLVRAADEVALQITPYSFAELGSKLGNDVGTTEKVFAEADVQLNGLKSLLVRAMPHGSLEQVVFRMDVLQTLERQGVHVINSPRAVEASVDKYLSLSLLNKLNVPIPATAVCQTSELALEFFEQFDGDVVLKPLFGSQGRGIERLRDASTAKHKFDQLAQDNRVIYLQKFVEHDGSDLRLLVIGDEVVGMRRVNRDHWITNIECGGKGVSHVPGDVERELAFQACRAVNGSLIGVDIAYGPEGPLVLEINSSPGWRALAQVARCDIAAKIIRLLVDRN